MMFNNGASSSRSPAPAAKKESRKDKFMKKIMNGDKVSKSASLQKRLPTLAKKAWELETLCGVTVCVVYRGKDGRVKALWPEEPEKVREAIESYRNAEKKQRIEETVLEHLEEGVKKQEKKKLRALGNKLSNWIDGLGGNDEGLRNAVGFLGSKIEELEERIRVLDLGLREKEEEDRTRKRVVMTSMAIEELGDGFAVGGESSDSSSDGVSRQVLMDLFPDNINGGGYGQFPLQEQSIQEEVGDDYGLGAAGSSDRDRGIPMSNEAMRSSVNSPFGCCGGGGVDFGLYETVPISVWNPQHQTGFGSDGQPGDFVFGL